MDIRSTYYRRIMELALEQAYGLASHILGEMNKVNCASLPSCHQRGA